MTIDEKLVIIAGARRGIGKTFFDHYSAKENVDIIGITRSSKKGLVQLDLYNEQNVREYIKSIPISKYGSVLYLHAVGIDKFEPNGVPHIDYDGIDDEVFASNVSAFKNLADPLIEYVAKENIPTTICNIGSISDQYDVPFWNSFSKAKNIVRQYVKSVHDSCVTGLMLNVSSTLDEEKNTFGRVNADTTYWQTAQELLEKSIDLVDNAHAFNTSFIEADFYKPNPNFRADYFTDLSRLYANWQKDMGLEGKKIPHGIRI